MWEHHSALFFFLFFFNFNLMTEDFDVRPVRKGQEMLEDRR